MVKLTQKSIIYIFAPGGITSGGPEAMHQLRFYLEQLGYNAYLIYYHKEETPDRYLIYKPKVLSVDDIIDSEDNLIIVPENKTKLLKNYKKAIRCIWWLGVQCYDGFESIPLSFKSKLRGMIRRNIPMQFWKWRFKLISKYNKELAKKKPFVIDKSIINLCGSKFAYDFTKKNFWNVHMLVEPISLEFLQKHNSDTNTSENKKDFILYNPAKSSTLMDKLLTRSELKFVPIKGLDIDQMVDLFHNSKIYIDFGFFGGPERLPKETVICDCLVLVRNRNAAKNNFDVAIPQEYKIDNTDDIDQIVFKLKYMLENYDKLVSDFKPFKNKVLLLEDNFKKQIHEIFQIN